MTEIIKPDTEYLVIKSFLDNNGNSYQTREKPYLYGELPKAVRDNTDFCIPLAKVEKIETTVIKYGEEKEYLGKPNDDTKPIELKAKQVKTNIKSKNL